MSCLPAWIDFADLWWIPLAVPCVLLIPYLLGPVLIYFTLRISGSPALDELELDSPVLPDPVTNYLFPTVRRMQEDGFEVLGAYFLGGLVPNVQNFLVLMGNRAARDTALLAVIYTVALGKPKLQQAHAEYCSRFTDGTIVDTNNSQELSVFAPLPWKHVLSLPWVGNVRGLYRIHRAAIEYHCPEKVKEWRVGDNLKVGLSEAIVEESPSQLRTGYVYRDPAGDCRPIGDDPKAHLYDALVEEMSSQVGTGYLYRDSAGDFRPTVKGAVLMTYKNLWPFTALRKALRRRRGERLLSRLRVEPARDTRAEFRRVRDDEYPR